MILKHLHTKDVIIIAIFIVVFVAVSYFSSKYGNVLKELVFFQGFFGMAFYVILLIAAEIIAPVSFLPILPLAVTLWGSLAAAVLSIAGWTIGATMAFFLARRYGRSLVGKIVDLEKIDEIGNAIPEKKLFWTVIILRMVFPVDILSYALGLFTKMKPKPYVLASFVGISPFAIILSYGVALPVSYQIILAVLVFIIIVALYSRAGKQIFAWLKK